MEADQGATIKVRVSFTDDANNLRDADQRGDGGRLGGADTNRDRAHHRAQAHGSPPADT